MIIIETILMDTFDSLGHRLYNHFNDSKTNLKFRVEKNTNLIFALQTNLYKISLKAINYLG